MGRVRSILHFSLISSLLSGVPCMSTDQDTTKVFSPAQFDSSIQTGIGAPVVKALVVDSTVLRGSAYGSLGDIFAEVPGAYYYDLGSVGQLALGSLFSGTPSNLIVDYDGLILNDPLTGKADLNLIPEESVGAMEVLCLPRRREFGFLPLGQSVQIESRNLASLPIKSRVAYRTGGNGYDDVDARLGIQASPELAINAGGLMKNYGGTVPFSKYRAQKINAKVDRQLGKDWQARYVFLLNKSDLDVPLPEPTLFPDLSTPHQKDLRYDHGLRISHGDNFYSAMQYTDLHREFYGYRHTVVDQVHDAGDLRLTSELKQTVGSLQVTTGGMWRLLRLDSNDWGQHRQWQLDGWANFSGKVGERLFWHFGLQVEKPEGHDTMLVPELSLIDVPLESFKVLLWANKSVVQPSFEAQSTKGPFALGSQRLYLDRSYTFGLGVEKDWSKSQFFFAATLQSNRGPIATWTLDPIEDIRLFMNLDDEVRGSLNLKVQHSPVIWLKLMAEGQQTMRRSTSGRPTTNRAETYAKGFLQISHVFFEGDLNAALRLGATFCGRRYGPQPIYLQSTPTTFTMDAVIVPYVHAIFIIKDVTLFVAMQNFLGLDYEVVHGYSMPKTQLRWGFVWNLFD